MKRFLKILLNNQLFFINNLPLLLCFSSSQFAVRSSQFAVRSSKIDHTRYNNLFNFLLSFFSKSLNFVKNISCFQIDGKHEVKLKMIYINI